MIQQTLQWYNGEIFEGKFILGFGVFLLLASLASYSFGNTPASRALLVPFLLISVFFTTTGFVMVQTNTTKRAEAKRICELGCQTQFIEDEIKRVEGFQYLYPMSLAISLLCFLVAITLLFFGRNVYLQATAIALILFGGAFAVIDYFSKERAQIYYLYLKDNAHDTGQNAK